MSNCFADFLQEKGLYDSIEISESNINDLLDLVGGKIKLSMYCCKCKEMRVFTMEPVTFAFEADGTKMETRSLADELRRIQEAPRLIMTPRPGRKNVPLDWHWSNLQTERATRIIVFPYVCAMDNNHHLDYVVKTDNNTMIKIGQFPSIASLTFPGLKQYDKVIDKQSRKELGTALGLHANGVGVGSYVYLRRIFERILDKARQQAMEDGFNTNGYDSMRVSDRIKLLKDYLPEMLNSNSVIYGILSKGIHELSEEDCIQYFPIMCESIYAILRQWEEKRQEQEAKKRLEKSLSAIASKV